MKFLSSFSARLYFSITLVAILIFGSAAWVEYCYSSRHEFRQASQYTTILLEDLIKSVHLQLMQVERSVNFYAPEVYNTIGRTDDMMEIARKLVFTDSCSMGAAIAFVPGYIPGSDRLRMDYVHRDSLGGVVATRYNDDSGYYYPSMEWYTGAIASDGGVWSEPYFDEGGGNVRMTTYSRALRDADGNPFAVITSDVELSSFVSRLEQLRPFPESYVFILDREGTYISHPDETLIMKHNIFNRGYDPSDYGVLEMGRHMVAGEIGSRIVHLGGRDLLICYAPMPHHGWSVACVTPYSTVIKRLGLASWTVLIIMLAGLVLMALCIRVLLRYMTGPLRQLVKAANRISEGDFNYPLTDDDGNGDISRLRRAFIDMQSSLRSYVSELTEATKSGERERSLIDVARVIQGRLLPRSFPIYPLRPEVDIYGRLDSGTGIVADIYDFHVFDNRLNFIISTSENRAVLSSLVLVVTRSMFRASIIRGESPAKMMTDINKLAFESKADYRESIFAGILDFATGELVYCNAGHSAPVIWRESEMKATFLPSADCPPCGERGGVVYHDERITLDCGDVIVACSEGFVSAPDYLGEPYGNERVLATVSDYLENGPTLSIQRMINHLFAAIAEHTGRKSSEIDRAVIALAYRNKPDTEGIVYADLTLKSALTDIPRLSTFIDDLAKRCDWSDQLAMKISLAFEEAVSSIIAYAYDDGQDGEIHITTMTTPNSFSVRLVDKGKPFDPTAEIKKMEGVVAEADMTSRGMAANKRAFGFFLINQIMDEMEYCRVGDENQLVMRKYF